MCSARDPADIIGLIPAAGRGTRLGPLPGSKELLPVGGAPRRAGAATVLQLLLARMSAAGIRRSVIVLRDGKWDIPSLLARADRSGIALAYVVLADSSSVVESLDAAFPFVAGQRVALGFPDILFEPEDAFRRAADLQAASGADVALALVPTDRPDKADIVAADPTGRVLEIAIKPRRHPRGAPAWTWVAAVWSPRFTAFLHRRAAAPRRGRELFPGQVFREALAEGFEIRAAVLAGGRHLDIGTPEDLERAIRESGVP